MKSKLLYAASFVALYLVFLVVNAPAVLLTKFAPIPDNVNLQGVTGTIWQTSVDNINVAGVNVENIETSLSALSLLSLNPSIQFESKGGLSDSLTGQGELQLSGEQLTVSHLTAQLPANVMVPFLNAPLPISAFGQVELHIEELTITGAQCSSASGKVIWQRAAISALEQTVELGDFNAQLTCYKDTLSLAIAPDNKLGLTFDARLTHQGQIVGNGYLKPGAQFPKTLNELLPFLGRKDGQGRYRLRL